jgi:hypothetical protein
MSSSVLKLNTLPVNQGNSIGAAFGEVAVAFKHLASALIQKAFAPAAAEVKQLTAFEEAEALRTYAAEIQSQDPDFAQDLFCAANRHEIEATALAQATAATAADDYSLPELRSIIANPVTAVSATA